MVILTKNRYQKTKYETHTKESPWLLKKPHESILIKHTACIGLVCETKALQMVDGLHTHTLLLARVSRSRPKILWDFAKLSMSEPMGFEKATRTAMSFTRWTNFLRRNCFPKSAFLPLSFLFVVPKARPINHKGPIWGDKKLPPSPKQLGKESKQLSIPEA